MEELPGDEPIPLILEPVLLAEHPCLSCGACCTRYRVSFYWGETTDAEGGIVPAELTEPLTHFRVMMKGTGGGSCMRCVALEGDIGGRIGCSIHEVRPSVCREFSISWENGERHDRCDESRLAYGLPPLRAWVLAPSELPPGENPRVA
jgi:Fe-S-cluster containining protein